MKWECKTEQASGRWPGPSSQREPVENGATARSASMRRCRGLVVITAGRRTAADPIRVVSGQGRRPARG